MRKMSCDSLRDKGGFGAVLDNSEKEHQAFTICESEDQFRLLSEEFVRERQHFDGKRQLLSFRVFLVKRGQTSHLPWLLQGLGLGAPSLPWLSLPLSGLELVGAGAGKTCGGGPVLDGEPNDADTLPLEVCAVCSRR